MEQIYLIEDCNGLKYVGRTIEKLSQRLRKHKYDKKRGVCSSKQLDLENCKISCLDIADSKVEARELEAFYINSIDCVNIVKFNFDFDEKEHKEYKSKYNKEYREKNKDEINRKARKARAIKKMQKEADLLLG